MLIALVDRLFPSKNSSKDSFVEDSFKNDPCLRALAQGRLPSKRSSHLDFRPSLGGQPPRHLASTTRQSSLSPIQTSQMLSSSNQSLKPALFRMYMTTLLPGVKYEDVPETDAEDGKLSTRAHTYSDSIPRAMGYSILDTLPNWRTRFPILAQIQARNELKCDVIHLDVSLELRYGSLPERSELWGKFEVLVPGKHNRQSVWRCTQSLHKPADLYGSPSTDPRYENMNSVPHVVRYEPGVGTHLRVSFPASPWAHALERLSTMEAQFEEAVQTGAPLPTPTTARQYIDQITMFQELFCSDAPNQPFTRRAILLWTFKKCKAGEQGQASWRYLDPLPPRSACFSPHPGTNHVVSAVMSENFGNWADNMSPSLNLSAAPNPFDSLSQYEELPTPVSTMTGASQMQYSFPSFGYSPADNLSFISHETQDSDATLVDVQNGANGVHMDSFLSTNGVLGSFDQSQNLWEAPPIQSFDNDVSFLANYGPTPSSAGAQVWEAGDGKHAEWEAADASYPTYDAHLSQRQK
jgi:transcriptional enhancer factor